MVRLVRIEHNGKSKLAAQIEGNDSGYCDLSSISTDARSFLHGGATTLAKAKELLSENATTAASSPLFIPCNSCKLLAPIDGSLVGKFLCIGMNYKDHCTEQNLPIPEEPVVFSKFGSNCIVGPNTPVVKDDTVTTKLDYEVELGIIIGSVVPRHTKKEDAMRYVGGYTIIHDVSARDWQMERNGGQWLLGKAMDGYAPLGPTIVTTDEFDYDKVHSAGIRCRVNGETVQDSNTSQLVFRVDDIIAFTSRFLTLQPGDVIATGTPPGVGCFRKPTPRWLGVGDVVECEIDGIGTLSNPIIGPSDCSVRKAEAVLVKPLPSSSGRLTGMTCIVTGAARGLGYGIAKKFGQEGATRVTVVDLDQHAIDDACKHLKENTGGYCDYDGEACDVSDMKSVTATWRKIAERNGGRIDVLAQAAGIVGPTNLATENVDADNFDQVFRVNVQGIFHGCKVVLPYMKKQGYGRIVNVASIAGKEGNAGMAAYSTSKAAVIGLTKSIGKEYAAGDSDITCNALAPAVVRTKMVEDMPDEQVKYMTDKIPMQRCGTIEEIADLVVFMASPQASFTTGFCFDATGGRAVY